MMYRKITFNHQEVKVSPDGTSILVNGVEVNQHVVRKRKRGASPFRYVSVKGRSVAVHRLVAMAYVPNPNGYKLVVHMDTDTLNNHHSNLQWGYQRMIAQNMKVAGRSYRNEKHFRLHSKIRAVDIPRVIVRLRRGETLRSIARDYGTSDMSVLRVKQRFYVNLK